MTDYRADIRRVQSLTQVRNLRRDSTDAESKLWQVLRSRQLAGAKFRRQHQFGAHILDFYCPAAKLAIELDGGQHYSEEGVSKDEARTMFLEANVIRVVRFTNIDVLTRTGAISEAILEVLADR